MKVKSLLIAAFAALSMSAVAGTFARDNVYIKDFEAKVGDEVTVDIYFDTETEYAAAQADIAVRCCELSRAQCTYPRCRSVFRRLYVRGSRRCSVFRSLSISRKPVSCRA